MNKKTTVLFDANPLIGQKSGVGQFSERFLLNYAEAHKDDSKITAYYFNFMGRKDTSSLPKHSSIHYKEVRFLPTKLLSLLHKAGMQVPYELFLGFKKYDFAVFPNFVSIPSLRKTPYYVAVHDLTFVDCPEYMLDGNQKYLSTFVPRSIKSAEGIITISEFTKKRILQNYKLTDEKIVVLPIPYEPTKPSGSVSSKIRSLAKEKFILFVGTIEPRKNIENLVKGYSLLPKQTLKDYRLVLAGAFGWKTEGISDAIDNAPNDANIEVTGYVSDAERDLLYSSCKSVALISHYEGFGMPILEAAHYKKSVVLNSIEVFKEVAGNNAFYCNGEDPEDIAKAIEQSIKISRPKTIPSTLSWKNNINRFDEIIKKTGLRASQ